MIPHEELADQKALVLDTAQPNQESERARAARKAGGLGIEERPLPGIAVRNRAFRKRGQQVRAHFRQV